MKRKFISTITLAVLFSNIIPLVAQATPNVEDIDNSQVEGSTENKEPNETNPAIPQEKVEVRKDFTDILAKYPKLKIIPQKDLLEVGFSTEMKQELATNIETLNVAINNKDKDLLAKTIKGTLELHTKMVEYGDVKLHVENDQFDYLMFNSIALMFELSEGDSKLRNQMLTWLVDEMYISSAKKFNNVQGLVFMGRYAQYLNKVVSPYIMDERTQEIILFAFSMINGIETFRPPLNPDENSQTKPTFPEEELPSIIDPEEVEPPPEIEEEIPPILPPIKPDVTPPTEGGDYVDPNQGYEEMEYVAKNGACYEQIKYYDNTGKLLKVVSKKMNKENNGYCGIYDVPVTDIDDWNDTHISDISADIWNNLSENDLNKLSPNTIQFTVNKDDKKPYYYDTGIKASSDGTVTFTQLKDAILNIVEKEELYLLEDKDKILVIAEGKTLVIKKKKTEYSKIDILNIFNVFKSIGLKVDEKKSLDSESIEDKLNNNELSEIDFKDEKVKLNKYPQLTDGILQLPLVQVANLVGYNVEDTKDTVKLTGKNDDKDIIIEIKKNSNEIIINGLKKTTTTKSQIVDGVVFSEMNLIIKEIGYNLIFNADLGTIEIK